MLSMWADPKDALQMKSRQNRPYCASKSHPFFSASFSFPLSLCVCVWMYTSLSISSSSSTNTLVLCFLLFFFPKGRKMIEVVFRQNYTIFFVADNFHRASAFVNSYIYLFNDWHTLDYAIVCYPFSFCLTNFFFFSSLLFFGTKFY